MSEVRFYHLTERRLEGVLPVMLERCLERGWRAVVAGTDPARLRDLDTQLWTYAAESFLPHGLEGTAPGCPADHPIWLTTAERHDPAPDALFLIDGATPDPAVLSAATTAAILFDGTDDTALARARDDWRAVVAAGLTAVYWAEEGGRWQRRAESG